MKYRRAADRAIDRAHHEIASAEMMVEHSFTDAHRQRALDYLFAAQQYLRRAIEARDAWDRVEHDDYEEYPEVPGVPAELACLD